MENKRQEDCRHDLPVCVTEFIRQVVRAMGYHRKARAEVEAELTAHFEDELRGCTEAQDREQRAGRLVEGFGNARLLAVLCRRSKKRCRPLWAKAMVRSLQTAGACLVLFVLYAVWFASGRPNIKVNYVALLNQMNQSKIAVPDDAWPHYERALALVKLDDDLWREPVYQRMDRPEYRDWARLPAEAQQAIALGIEANRAAWEQFLAASSKPYCVKSYRCADEAGKPRLFKVKLPELSGLVRLSKMGIWMSRRSLAQGRTRDALDTCLAVARAGRHWQQGGFLFEQMTGTFVSCWAHEEILAILGHQMLSESDLETLQRELAGLYPASYPLIDMEESKLGFLDVVQQLFTAGGPGGGHMIPARAAEAITGSSDAKARRWRALCSEALSFIHAGRERTVAKANEIFDLQDKLLKMSPYERRFRGVPREDLALMSGSQPRYALIRLMFRAVDRPADDAFRAKALHEATLTVVALQRYRLAKGSYPATLGELKQVGYLDTLPADPYDKGPLVYRGAGDSFKLYSLGPNFCDDGCRAAADPQGQRQMWAERGDTIFWPVP